MSIPRPAELRRRNWTPAELDTHFLVMPDTHFSIRNDRRRSALPLGRGSKEDAFAIAKTDEDGSTFGTSMCSHAGSPKGNNGER